jgi:hypothetical protein
MIRYTVVWHAEAQDRLVQIWLTAPDRKAVTSAADAIDAILAWDAPLKGTFVEGGLSELLIPPLRVLFGVSEPDRIVRIVNVESS